MGCWKPVGRGFAEPFVSGRMTRGESTDLRLREASPYLGKLNSTLRNAGAVTVDPDGGRGVIDQLGGRADGAAGQFAPAIGA